MHPMMRAMLAAAAGTSGGGVPTGGLILHYDASTLVLADGAPISQWDDESGHGSHATQATAGNRPTYDANGMGPGKAGVRFDVASSQYLSIPNVLAALTEGDIYVVAKTIYDPARADAESGLWKLGSSGSTPHYPFSDGSIYDDAGSTTRKTEGNPAPPLTTPRLYHVRSGVGLWTTRLDGAQLFTTASNVVGFSTAPTLGRAGSGSPYLNGWIAELLAYGAHLSDADRTALEAALLAKWTVTPRSGSGLLLQYDASAIAGLADGDALSQWDDDSGNDYHATQATSANRPTYDVDAFGSGKPGVRFTGASSQFLRLPSVLDQASEAHVFVVVKLVADPSFTHVGLWRLGSSRDATNYPWTDGNIYDAAGSNTRRTVGNPTPLLSTSRLYQVTTAPTEWTARLDTTQLFTTAVNTVSWSGRPTLGLSLGTGVNQYLDGWIGEFRVYYGPMTSGERATIEAALKAKWGLTGY